MAYTNLDQLKLDKETKIASANAPTTPSATYTQSEIQAICTLLNEIKTKLNTIFQV